MRRYEIKSKSNSWKWEITSGYTEKEDFLEDIMFKSVLRVLCQVTCV